MKKFVSNHHNSHSTRLWSEIYTTGYLQGWTLWSVTNAQIILFLYIALLYVWKAEMQKKEKKPLIILAEFRFSFAIFGFLGQNLNAKKENIDFSFNIHKTF